MKYIKYIVFILTFLLIFTCTVNAKNQTEEGENIDISSFYEAIPKELIPFLSEDLPFSKNAVQAVEYFTPGVFYKVFVKLLKSLLPSFTKKLCSLLGLITLVSLINRSGSTLATPFFSKTVSYVSLIGTSVFIYNIMGNIWAEYELFLKSLNVFINASLPITTLLHSVGGNVTTAALHSSVTLFILSFANVIVYDCAYPLIRISLGLSVASGLGNTEGVKSVTKVLKNIFTLLLSTSATLFSFYLIFKTNITAAADGVAARTIKFAGSFVPVIGSAVGESVRSVMSGLSLIKSSVGYVGIAVILIITLPTLLSIILNKICLDISASAAEILGCSKEASMLGSFSSALGFYLAVTVCISLLFILDIAVFTTVSPGLGGGI